MRRRALLDINVLLALLDSDHVDHTRAHDWLDADFKRWLGVVRDH